MLIFLKKRGDIIVMQKTYTVYKITNIINGKCYIGQTRKTAKRRFTQHKCRARKGYENDRPIYKAIQEFGEDNFIVESLECGIDESNINQREQFWIEKENSIIPSGYNVNTGGRKDFKYPDYAFPNRRSSNYSPYGDIIMLDKDTNEEIAIFRSSTQAERFLRRSGYPKANHWPITKCCMGRQKVAYGHKWKFRDDMIRPEQRPLSGDSDLR